MENIVCEVQFVHQDKVDKIQKAMEAEGLRSKMSNMFRVLCDPTRLKIILALELEERGYEWVETEMAQKVGV